MGRRSPREPHKHNMPRGELRMSIIAYLYYYSAKSGGFPFASSCTASRMQSNCIQNKDEKSNLAL